MTEHDLIRTIAGHFPRSRQQVNGLFECDAEIVRIGGEPWGMSLDEFSPEEDLFTSSDPVRLGRNLAVATLSDLLAAGILPRFFMHALTLPQTAPTSFAEELCAGIADVLDRAGCCLIGGDLGLADTWRYCGFAMGPAANPEPVTRRFSPASKTLWTTGRLGDANLAILSGEPTPDFELRLEEAGFIRKHATACMDTSGGLMDALWTLHTLNPDWRMDLFADRIPLTDGVSDFARSAGLPPEAALIGGAGEYELIFATDGSTDPPGCTRIADLSKNAPGGLFVHPAGKDVRQVTRPPPCPRAAASRTAYLQDIIAFAEVFEA